jgi:hypothetical protein
VSYPNILPDINGDGVRGPVEGTNGFAVLGSWVGLGVLEAVVTGVLRPEGGCESGVLGVGGLKRNSALNL